MIGFTLGAAALVIIVLAALLPPLLRRGPDGSGGNRRAGVLVGLGLPAAAVGLYLAIGTPQGVNPPPPDTAHTITPERIEQMIGALARRLEASPDDAQGWLMLGRSYRVLDRLPEAAKAYAQAVRLMPDNADLIADYADVQAAANGGSMKGEPLAAVERALKLDPDNIKALALAGSAAFEADEFGKAVTYWKRALAKLPAEAEIAQAIEASVREAEALAAASQQGRAKAKP